MSKPVDEPQFHAIPANAGPPALDSVILADGTRVPTRPIGPGDSDALQRFHSRLSAGSIFLRFFHYVPVLTPDRAAYFTQLDGVDRYAIVALDPANPAAIIGVVRYDRELGTEEAEYAIVVEDRWQGRGLGLALTRQLVAVARAHGIRRFYAYVLPENSRMLHLFQDLPLLQHGSNEEGVWRIDLDLFHEEHARS
ncbi:MAG TPA: GNAT family N-acetyltransferase [Chloroflexia bacterium]|nr:GNAT family N-acetyltransferase [Chloroflexia bacterium]